MPNMALNVSVAQDAPSCSAVRRRAAATAPLRATAACCSSWRLPHIAIDDRLLLMRWLSRPLLLIVCTVVLLGGSMFSVAGAVAGNCTHERSHHEGIPAPHKDHDAGCLTCCLGMCVAIPDLPSRTTLSVARFAVAHVNYFETEVSLSGRSVRPDPAPPRTGT